MRGRQTPQTSILALMDLETRIAPTHPIRAVRFLTDAALAVTNAAFAMASQNARWRRWVSRRVWAPPAEPSARRSGQPVSAACSLRESEPTPYRPRFWRGALHDTFFAVVLVLLIGAVLVLPSTRLQMSEFP